MKPDVNTGDLLHMTRSSQQPTNLVRPLHKDVTRMGHET